MTDSPKCNLVLVHTPRAQQLSDWAEIKEKINARAPDIDVRIVNNNQPDPDIDTWQRSRASLVFCPCNLTKYRPAGGKVYAGRPMEKLDQLRRLADGGVPTPRTLLMVPGLSLDPAEWGEYVLIKPTAPGASSYARGISVARADEIGERFGELTNGGKQRMLVQQLIDAIDDQDRIYAYRALVIFGRPLYIFRSIQLKKRPPLEEIRDQGSNVIAHNAWSQGMTWDRTFVEDADLVDMAARAADAMHEFPVLGLDLVRERSTGKLHVLETNCGGNVWHLSSDVGLRFPHKFRRKMYNQFGALDVAADVLIEKTRKEATLFT